MTLQLDIALEDPRWATIGFDALAHKAATATLTYTGIDPSKAEISILACDDARIADLNSAFRDKPAPTNVLSWPEDERGAETEGDRPAPPDADPDGTISLGDIAIAYETCETEATAAKIPMADHVTHLIVHGVLHLLGYDHVRDGDAVLMEGLETKILRTLDISDPYRADTD